LCKNGVDGGIDYGNLFKVSRSLTVSEAEEASSQLLPISENFPKVLLKDYKITRELFVLILIYYFFKDFSIKKILRKLEISKQQQLKSIECYLFYKIYSITNNNKIGHDRSLENKKNIKHILF
jgi:hypothetical protein